MFSIVAEATLCLSGCYPMLSKKNRTDTRTVKEIFEKGRFASSSNLTFKFILQHDGDMSPRVSFVVPKNVSKIAPKRNLLRRRGYGVLRKYIHTLPRGLAGVFIFNKKSAEIFGGRKNKNHNPILFLEEEIKNLLKKSRFI